MERLTKLSLFAFFTLLTGNLLFASKSENLDYRKAHADIVFAVESSNIKEAKSLVKQLFPAIDADIAYIEEIIADEEDEDFLADLNRRKTRQEEIKAQLQQFLKIRKADKMLADESLNMIKELRRLSLRPKSR